MVGREDPVELHQNLLSIKNKANKLFSITTGSVGVTKEQKKLPLKKRL